MRQNLERRKCEKAAPRHRSCPSSRYMQWTWVFRLRAGVRRSTIRLAIDNETSLPITLLKTPRTG